MFALTFLFGGAVVLSAQDTTSYQYRTDTQSQYPGQTMNQQQDRERISATELPEEVKRQLEGQEYRGWLISGAFKYTGDQSMMSDSTGLNQQGGINARTEDQELFYIIELKNGAQTQTVWFDENGQEVQGMEEQSETGNNQYSPADGQGQPYQQNDQMNQQNDQMNQDEMNPPDPNSPYQQPNDQYNQNGQQDQSGQYNQGQSRDYNQGRENPYQPGQPQQTEPTTPSTTPDGTSDQNDQSSQYQYDQRDRAGQTDPTLESGTPGQTGTPGSTGQSTETGTDRGTP